MTELRASVRQVVEFSLHERDLSPAAFAAKRMREGAAAHKARQSAGAREETAYQAEKSLSADYAAREITLRVTGRADGLLLAADGARIVEEIKLGTAENPLVPAHRAQAAMYGHMLCQKEGLTGVRLRILYVDENGAPVRLYEEEADSARLKGEFEALCAAYCAWAERLLARRRARDTSLFGLAFPYGVYRAGQRTFAANVYVAIRERKRLFAQAPTGIGKTMAALYPAALALGEGKCARVLMLTARTTGRKSAMDALAILRAHGARLLAVEIAAKDKVCPMEKRDCRPEVCPYAKGFYDRLPDALAEALIGGDWGRGQLDALARKHKLCPFELALSLAQEADVVVCDYNYVFDPFVAIDALMQGGAALLIDEAHQLAPRVQDNASAAVSVPQLRALRRGAGQALGRKHPLYGALTAAIRALEAAAGTEEFASGRLERPPEALDAAMARLLDAADGALLSGAGTEAAEAFTLAACWRYAAGRLDARYAVLTEGTEKTAKIELFLLCAAQDILEKTKRARGAVFFSATLALPSPFDKHQLDARILPIDLRYAAREANAPRVAEAIRAQLAAHPGNAMVFFPSYAYLSRVDALLAAEGVPGAAILREARGLTEEEKNALLSAFDKRDGRTVLLAVLGGAFAEGVDLAGERLQNVIVVSTGLPQMDARVRAMRRYHDENGADGAFLCMTLPGMVRVIQSAGLIRTQSDHGALLLIDSRYQRGAERALLSGTLIGDALSG